MKAHPKPSGATLCDHCLRPATWYDTDPDGGVAICDTCRAELYPLPAHCQYYGCEEPLAPNQPLTGMKFCAKHDAELEAIAKSEKIPALFKFWIDAQGGPKQAAKRMMEE